MNDPISRFRTPDHATRYFERYDDIVTARWPVIRHELDVPTRFGTTHVRRSGPAHGTPIVMIHPTTGSSAGWYPVIAALCERHPVYTPDTIGTPGRSIQTAPIRSPGGLSSWLDDVLDALELDTIHLIGYSEGGWIAGLHAAHAGRPGRVNTLTLIEPSGAIARIPRRFIVNLVLRGVRTLLARDKHQAIRDLNHWMNGVVELTDEQIELLLLAMRSFRQKLPRPTLLTDEELHRITASTLLLLGADTRLHDPDQVADRARRHLVDVTVEVMPDAGHGLLFQYPEPTTSRILRFIGEHEVAAGTSLD